MGDERNYISSTQCAQSITRDLTEYVHSERTYGHRRSLCSLDEVRGDRSHDKGPCTERCPCVLTHRPKTEINSL